MITTFAALRPGRQVVEINLVLDCLHEAEPFPALDSPAAVWLERMEHALAAGVPAADYLGLEGAWRVFLARRPEAERAGLEDRLARFARILRVAPPDATSRMDIVVAMLDTVLEQGSLAS